MKQRIANSYVGRVVAKAWDRIRHGQDETPAATSPSWPMQIVVWVLLPIAIVGAGALSASATLALATEHHVDPYVRPALVAMVEVVSLAATLLTIFSTVRSLRVRAMGLIIAATAVAMVAGWQRYSWVGLLAGGFLVYLIHLASAAWLELRRRQLGETQVDTDIIVVPTNPEPDHAQTQAIAAVPEPETEPVTIPSELGDLPPELVGYAREILAATPVGRPTLLRMLRVRYPEVTDNTAKRLLAALRPLKPVEGASA